MQKFTLSLSLLCFLLGHNFIIRPCLQTKYPAYIMILTLKVPKKNMVEYANSVGPDEVAH